MPTLDKPRLPAIAAFYLNASIIVSLLAGSTAPTPLYGIYRTQWGFTPTLLNNAPIEANMNVTVSYSWN